MSRSVWAARLVVLAAFLDLFAQFPVIAPYAQEIGAGPGMVALIMAAYSAANLLGNLGAGFVLDRWGRKPSLVAGLIGSAAALALYSQARSPEQLLALRVLHGLATAVLSPGAFALIGDAAPPERRARAMGSAGAFIAIAAVVGPSLAGIGRDRFGAPTVFLVVAIVLATAAALVSALAHEITPVRDPRTGPRTRPGALLGRAHLRVAYGAVFALTVGLGTLVTHLPVLLVARGEGARGSGTAFTIYALVALVGMAGPAARAADRYGRRRPLAAGLALIGLALAGLALAGAPAGVLASMAVFGLGFGLLFPAATALVADSSAPAERGLAYGLFYAVYSFGVVVGSLGSGVLASAAGTHSPLPFLLGAVAALVAVPFVLASRLERAATMEAPLVEAEPRVAAGR